MNQVEFVETQEHSMFRVLQDRWEFNPAGRFQFLQRWAWRFLLWRGALKNQVAETLTYTRHVIDTDDVMERLMRQRVGLFDYHREPKELLIGSEDFAELMRSPALRNQADFSVDLHHGRRVMGLTVRIIPWMRGMVVMP